MILTYRITHEEHINRGGYDDLDYCDDGEYEYEVTPSGRDFFKFLGLESPNDVTKEERLQYIKGALDAIDELWRNDFLNGMLEDEGFIDFMKDEYRSKAEREAMEELGLESVDLV